VKRLAFLIGLILVVGMITVACGISPFPSGSNSSQPATAPVPGGASGAAGIQADKGASSSSASLPDIPTDRMIVRNGNLSLRVTDVTNSRDQISQMATGLGGYVVSSSIFSGGNTLTGSIGVRVPDDKFERAIAQIRGLAVKVDNESTSSQDITQEYVDLQARLKNSQATESQYLTLLTKATTVQDILSIQDKLSQTRQQIEQIKGRIQYLDQNSAMSLITISLNTVEDNNPVSWLDWNFLGILKSAASGLVIFLQVLFAIAIWAIVFSPIWGSVVGIIYWRRHKKKSRASQARNEVSPTKNKS
jgi:hypothetical protein